MHTNRKMEDSKSLIHNTTHFDKSLRELRDLSSQLYHAADYCETTFLKAEDKRDVVENTKQYISRAVVTVVDHLGSISANLECYISKTNSVPETENKIESIKQRIVTCQQYSHKLALSRIYWGSEFSRYHCRYILPPSKDSAMLSLTKSRISERCIGANNEEVNEFEIEGPLFLYTYNCKPSLAENSTGDKDKKDESSPSVVPVRDGMSVLPKQDYPSFQFKEAQKLKRSMLNWRLKHNKDIASLLIRRGKRILA